MGLTENGSAALVLDRFRAAEIALFDGTERVTEWTSYEVGSGAGVAAPRTVERPTLAIRRTDRTQNFWWSGVSLMTAGDVAYPPPIEDWYQVDTRRFLT